MKKIYYSILLMAIVSFAFYGLAQINGSKTDDARTKLRKQLAEHPYTLRPRYVEGEIPQGGKPAAPDRAWEQDYLRTMDPALGRPTPEVLVPIMTAMSASTGFGFGLAPGAVQSPWVERGPNNVGGRTRGLAWDPNSQTGLKVWAGGVNGGLWYNNDITSSSSSWNQVDDFWSNIAITSIAFDPVDPQIVYVGTGEGFTSNGGSSARGAGIWKSVNGGNTWNHLTSTSGFYWILDIVIRDEGAAQGVVYAAVDGRYHAGDFHGLTTAGIQRSTNGGSSFSNVSPNVPSETIKLLAADLEIGANGRIWAGSRENAYSAGDKGGGRIFYSDNGTNWTISSSTSVNNNDGRVAIACAQSDSNYVYAIVENGGQCDKILKTSNYGSSWSSMTEPSDADNGIPTSDFTRGQAWYDLVIAVDPNDADIVLAGGIDLFRTTNGASNWSQISKWSNNNNLAGLTCSYVHSDHHAIIFKPGSSSTLIFGNDGGVFYTSSISTAINNAVISERNKDYNVTQYYACAIHPTANSNIYLAGSQDNGTQRYFTSGMNATNEVNGGDGGYCFIDQVNPAIAISSYVYNNFYLSGNTGLSFPINLINDNNTGKFINPADYHDGDKVLYTGKGSGTIWRIKNISGTPPAAPETMNITGMSDPASHIRCSPYSSTLFIGSDVGEIFKVTNANGSYSITDITGSNLPAGSVSCIEIGASDNELLATYFNYGVVSVWYSSNGGANWVNKEGNLPNMPVRWALFNPNNRNEVILATNLGVWSTSDLSASNPVWVSSSSGLANTRIDMLQIRSSDMEVIAATHGRGLFSSKAFAAKAPLADFKVSAPTTCTPQKLKFTDLSVFDPTDWNWSFSPSTVIYVDGTSDTSQNPIVRFTNAGTYQVTLTATNSLGSDSEVKNALVSVTAALSPTVTVVLSANPVCSGILVNFTATPDIGGASPVYEWKINGLTSGSNSPNFSSSNLKNGDTVVCEMLSSDSCTFPVPMVSNKLIMEVLTSPNVSFFLPNQNTCINENPFTLSGGSPLGGSYGGKSVVNNIFDPVLAGFGAHTMTYSFTNSNGCMNSASDVINVSNLPNKPAITHSGNILTCSVIGAFYEWTLNGIIQPLAINRNLTITKSGTYQVKVTNGFGCENNSDPLQAFMVGSKELQNDLLWKLYPNPSTGDFIISSNLTEPAQITIRLFDATGKLVYEMKENNPSGIMEKAIHLNLAPGSYFVHIHNGNAEWRKTLIILAQ